MQEVFFDKKGECYVAVGYKTSKQAIIAINRFEKKNGVPKKYLRKEKNLKKVNSEYHCAL